MLINMIGTDEERPVDFETWKGEPENPRERETLSMAVQAAVASFAAGSSVPTRRREVAPVGDITASQPAAPDASRVDAA